MSKKLYLMRHGETLFNVLGRIQGWCDSPLTDRGIAQAKTARQWFAAHHVMLTEAHCSTAERASDTLELVCDLPYTREKGLREHGFGRFEGQPEYLNPAIPYGDFFVPYGGENDATTMKRVVATVDRLMAAAPDGAQVLMVSHAGATHSFLAQRAPAGVLNERMPNCGIAIFDYDGGTYTFEQIVDPVAWAEQREDSHDQI
ncbi:histidine phosphatase family protein [Lacticaseibacillus hegangensis]|uniref:Histidine phosphatase family protein n=1 Tax=Lacticaseibacillus hegangensis TaxID=2486010 RepID=A0ABW4CUH6_9LACO|nr:histidine phosphatase family protein [Lacticaseibacillus hegangensis]